MTHLGSVNDGSSSNGEEMGELVLLGKVDRFGPPVEANTQPLVRGLTGWNTYEV